LPKASDSGHLGVSLWAPCEAGLPRYHLPTAGRARGKRDSLQSLSAPDRRSACWEQSEDGGFLFNKANALKKEAERLAQLDKYKLLFNDKSEGMMALLKDEMDLDDDCDDDTEFVGSKPILTPLPVRTTPNLRL